MKKINPIAALVVGAAMIAGFSASIAQAQSTDTLAKIKASGTITMGVRDSSGALSYTLGDGKYTGYHVEICQRVIANVEKAVGKKLNVQYQLVTSQNRIPLVQNGTVDIECGSTTNNATRQKDVSFLPTVYMEQVRIAVKAKSPISNIEGLNGKTVATTTGTTSVQLLRKNERSKGIDFKELMGKDHADSFLLLESDRADAFVMDATILIGNIMNSKSPADFKIVGEVLSNEPIGIMVRKNDAAFKKIGDDTIKDLVKSGEIQKIYAKWFTSPSPPKGVNVNMALTSETKSAWANLSDKPLEEYSQK